MIKRCKVFVMFMVLLLSPMPQAKAEEVVITKVIGTSEGVLGTLLVEQPKVISCATAPSAATGKTRCDFSIRTRLESGSLNTIINIEPVDENGIKVGFIALSIMYPDANWKPMRVTVTVEANTRISFAIRDSQVLTNTSVEQSFSSFSLTGSDKKPFSLVPKFPSTVKSFKGENVNLGTFEFPQAVKAGIEAIDVGWGTAIAKGYPVMLFSYPTVMRRLPKCGVVPFQAVALDPSSLQPILTKYAVFNVEIWSQSGILLSSGSLGTSTAPWSKVTNVSTLSIPFCRKAPQDSKTMKLIITAGQSLAGQFVIREYRTTLNFK